MTGKELVKQLQKKGWKIERTNGSHYIMKKGGQTEIIPYHTKDLKPGLFQSIKKRTGLE